MARLNLRLQKHQKEPAPATLREVYPQLAEVRVEFDFQDGTSRPPALQSFAHFPAARGQFHYPCPCHSCDGQFDLDPLVAELANDTQQTPRARLVTVNCTGQRLFAQQERGACPIRASIRISARRQTPEQPA